MSYNAAWGKSLGKETLSEFMKIGDGHTLFDPEAYIEIGIPKDIVAHYTKTHTSPKRPHPDAVTSLVKGIHKVFGHHTNGDAALDHETNALLKDLLDQEDTYFAEQVAGELIDVLNEDNIETLFGYHPKEAMWDNQGQVIESLDAVYGLDITQGLVHSLKLKYDSKMGRGFQYMSYCKAIQEYIDKHFPEDTTKD